MTTSKALINLGQAALGYRDVATGVLATVKSLPFEIVDHLKATIELADKKYNAAREDEKRLPALKGGIH